MFKRLALLFSPEYRKYVIVAGIFFVIGLALTGTYATAVDYTNRLEFCAFNCHEMSVPYEEYKKSKHYQNAYGVRAECPDCHVPHKKWQFTFMAKLGATKDLFEHLFGHMAHAPDPKAQFEADRLELAKDVWARMKATDSRECRNCHSFEAMMASDQPQRAQVQHAYAQEKGKTCIDCHKGITHKQLQNLIETPASSDSFDVGG